MPGRAQGRGAYSRQHSTSNQSDHGLKVVSPAWPRCHVMLTSSAIFSATNESVGKCVTGDGGEQVAGSKGSWQSHLSQCDLSQQYLVYYTRPAPLPIGRANSRAKSSSYTALFSDFSSSFQRKNRGCLAGVCVTMSAEGEGAAAIYDTAPVWSEASLQV